jgi:acyl-[acyl-carrier-protein]-phospholipid O-acyltransferase/long-chain-fatty-acid--[acyl-carrier-protein] ligase
MNLPGSVGGNGRQAASKPGSVGLPLCGVATRVVDAETFRPLAPGEEGLLLVKGGNVMRGYLNEPERTAAAFHEGWYVTGDIACVDEEGFVTIRDRLSRFSKIGGEMVPHEKIESEIEAILGPSDERRCVVTGIPDEGKGEKLVAVCRRNIDVARLHERLRQTGLPNLWIPRRDAFVQVDDLPMLGSGKLDLKGVKALAAGLARAA